jgi:hypothetical protein
MRPLSVREMIRVWEGGDSRSPVDQALLLLKAGGMEGSLSDLAKLHVAERDRRLLQLREGTFGPRLSCSVDCPFCSEDLAFELETRQILEPPLQGQTETFTGGTDQLTVHFRLPNSEDLVDGLRAASPEEARRRILKRCLLSARKSGAELPFDDLSSDDVDKLSTLMGNSDPQAETRFGVECLACRKTWQVMFDITAFFWKEISVRARRALSEVHVLAYAYGWNEEEILGMSAARREFYLQMVNS